MNRLLELTHACRSADVAQRVAAVMEIEENGAIEAVDVVLECLDDPDETVRSVSARAAGMLGALLGAPAFIGRRLLGALTDSGAMVRFEAVESLGQLRFVESGDLLEQLLLTDECDLVRAEAALSLGSIGRLAAVPAIERALADAAPLVRMDAAAALAMLGSVDSVSALRRAASAEVTGWELREHLVALYRLGEHSALGELLVAAGGMTDLEAQTAIEAAAEVVRSEHVTELLAGLDAIPDPGPGLQVEMALIRQRLGVPTDQPHQVHVPTA